MDIINSLQIALEKFLNNPQKYILWGAGDCGEHCYRWLQKCGLEANVVAFVDSNAHKQGQELYNIPIHSCQAAIKMYSTAFIIICTQYHESVYATIQQNQLTNPVFVFEDRLPRYYENETYEIDPHDLYSIYSNDRATRTAIDLCIWIRSHHFGAIIPYELVPYISIFREYWGPSELSLAAFDHITLVDAGAFIGDTIEPLHRQYKDKLAQIHAFEPDPGNYNALIKLIAALGIQEITTLYQCGLSNTKEVLSFHESSDTSGFIKGGNIQVAVQYLDVIKLQPKGKLCIKMDIGGFEMQALQGAAETITTYHPELAICIYHKYADILTIPKLIKSIAPEYTCILRCGPHMECYASTERFNNSK